jgi:hypothetical protein
MENIKIIEGIIEKKKLKGVIVKRGRNGWIHIIAPSPDRNNGVFVFTNKKGYSIHKLCCNDWWDVSRNEKIELRGFIDRGGYQKIWMRDQFDGFRIRLKY